MANPKEAQVGLPPSEPITTLERVDLVRGWQTQTLDTLLGLPEAATAQADKFIALVNSDEIPDFRKLDFPRGGVSVSISFEKTDRDLSVRMVDASAGLSDEFGSLEVLSKSALTGDLAKDGFFYAFFNGDVYAMIAKDDTVNIARAQVDCVSELINRFLGIKTNEHEDPLQPPDENPDAVTEFPES